MLLRDDTALFSVYTFICSRATVLEGQETELAYAYSVVSFNPSDSCDHCCNLSTHVTTAAELTLCSVRSPAVGVTGAGVALTADTGMLKMGADGTGGTGGGDVGIGAAAAGVGDGASAGFGGSGSSGGAAGDGGGFTSPK